MSSCRPAMTLRSIQRTFRVKVSSGINFESAPEAGPHQTHGRSQPLLCVKRSAQNVQRAFFIFSGENRISHHWSITILSNGPCPPRAACPNDQPSDGIFETVHDFSTYRLFLLFYNIGARSRHHMGFGLLTACAFLVKHPAACRARWSCGVSRTLSNDTMRKPKRCATVAI